MYVWGSGGNVHEWILSFSHEGPGDKSGSQAWQHAALSSKPWLVGGFIYTRIHHLQHTTLCVHLRPSLLLQGMLWRDKGVHCCFQTIPLFWHGAWCVIGIQWTLCVANNEWAEIPSWTKLCLFPSPSQSRGLCLFVVVAVVSVPSTESRKREGRSFPHLLHSRANGE